MMRRTLLLGTVIGLAVALVAVGGRRMAPIEVTAPIGLPQHGEAWPGAVFGAQCAACHGMDGAGRGLSSFGMRPPPRNLRQGPFKFAGGVGNDALSRQGLRRTLFNGLYSTPMRAWSLRAVDVETLVDEIGAASGQPVMDEPPLEPDPWQGRSTAAIELGTALYGTGSGSLGCAHCHERWQSDGAMLSESDWVGPEQQTPLHVLPPPLRWDTLKTIPKLGQRYFDGEAWTVADEAVQRAAVYRLVRNGVGGAGMPPWRGVAPPASLWAIAYAVVDALGESPKP